MLINKKTWIGEDEFIVGLLTRLFVVIIDISHDSILKLKWKSLCRAHTFHVFSSVLWWLTLTSNSLKIHL